MRVCLDPEVETVAAWLFSDDTGMSSKSLAAEFLDAPNQYCCTPSDPADLGRCLRLIAIARSVRACVDSLGAKNKSWAKAAAAWDQLAALMESEVGIDWHKGGAAPLTFDAMKATGL